MEDRENIFGDFEQFIHPEYENELIQSIIYPDIVTMGKAFGNGIPLAAVIMTQEIADHFSSNEEYFNTFGGNPVSCCAGISVLNFISENNLQEKALQLGDYRISKFRKNTTKIYSINW